MQKMPCGLSVRLGTKHGHVLNLSFGGTGHLSKDYTEQDIRFNFGQTIAVLAQTGVQDKTILVWAAGNCE